MNENNLTCNEVDAVHVVLVVSCMPALHTIVKLAVYHATFLLSFEVWNLANGEDVEETKKQVEKYKKDNENLIRKNNFKLVSLTSFFHPPLISSTYSQSAA